MTIQHATPPRFGTTPLDESDDLFALRDQTCADCGQSFQTSRVASYCARCASLRVGQLGPATVECPVCRVEHQMPILASSKLCPPCRLDLDLCRSNIAADVAAAEKAFNEAVEAFCALYGRADEALAIRCDNAIELRQTLRLNGIVYTKAQARAAWRRAVLCGDALSVLLIAHDQLDAARARLDQTRARAAVALEAVEEAE